MMYYNSNYRSTNTRVVYIHTVSLTTRVIGYSAQDLGKKTYIPSPRIVGKAKSGVGGLWEGDCPHPSSRSGTRASHHLGKSIHLQSPHVCVFLLMQIF